MPTLNLTIGQSWTKVADASHAGFVASSEAVGHIEWATTTADSAPTVAGHLLDAQLPVGRGLLGPGHVWARLRPPAASAALAVTR